MVPSPTREVLTLNVKEEPSLIFENAGATEYVGCGVDDGVIDGVGVMVLVGVTVLVGVGVTVLVGVGVDVGCAVNSLSKRHTNTEERNASGQPRI